MAIYMQLRRTFGLAGVAHKRSSNIKQQYTTIMKVTALSAVLATVGVPSALSTDPLNGGVSSYLRLLYLWPLVTAHAAF